MSNGLAKAATNLQCDVLIFVVTPSERKQLKNVAQELGLSYVEQSGFLKYIDLGEVGYQRVMAVETEMGPLSFDGSASKAIHAIKETRATALASVGMAFAVDATKQPPESVLVSTSVLPYDNRIVEEDSNGTPKANYSRTKPHPAKPSLLTMLQKHSQAKEWKGKIIFGAMLSGAAVIRSAAFRDDLVLQLSSHGDTIVGGEMEAIGLLATCSPSEPSWVVVKGVCDYADGDQTKSASTHRTAACYNSIKFFLSALLSFKI